MKLIRAGRRLFGEFGLYESRIEDLARSAKIAKGTVYTYFEDKDELILAVVEDGFAELAERMALGAGRATEFEAVARDLVRIHLDFFVGNPDLMRVLLQVRGRLKFGHPGAKPFRDVLAGHLRLCASALARSPRFAALSARERMAVTRLGYGAISGVTSTQAVLGIRTPAARELSELAESLTGLMVKRVEIAEACPRPRRA